MVPTLAMHDTFKHCKSDIYTLTIGGALGMAGFLLACGAPASSFVAYSTGHAGVDQFVQHRR